MVTLGIEYLNGWAMAAADGPAKSRAEWPPHPDRVFMAMAAAYFETEGADEEAAALQWLERQPPPIVQAAPCDVRTAVGGNTPPVAFVPVNDVKVGKPREADSHQQLLDQGLSVFPAHRKRQPRSFPVAVPEDPVVYLVWPDGSLESSLQEALSHLCRKVTHVGHSASLVQMWVEATPPATKPSHRVWTPHDGLDASMRLRVPYEGRFSYLAASDPGPHVRHAMTLSKRERGNYLDGLVDRLRPRNSRWQGYRPSGSPKAPATAECKGNHFDPRLQVLRVSGGLPAGSVLQVVTALRTSLLTAQPDAPEWVSGLTADGAPSRGAHMALAPLINAGHAHADGRLMGVAIVLPRGLDEAVAAAVLRPWLLDDEDFPKRIPVFHGAWFEASAELDEREVLPHTLMPETWVRESTTWESVTPVVMDRHPRGRDPWPSMVEAVERSCAYIGLPRPVSVELARAPFVSGPARADNFPLLRRPDGTAMRHLHARVVFTEPVEGPVILGAGRYRGYGVCRPRFPQPADQSIGQSEPEGNPS